MEKIKNKNGNCVKEQRTEQTEKLKLILKTGNTDQKYAETDQKKGETDPQTENL